MGFLEILSDDVHRALQNLGSGATASDRRNVLRTIISATEGLAWTYRSHILSIATDMGAVSKMEELAFSEFTILVNDSGKISKQYRNVPLIASIRLTTHLAKSMAPHISVDFGTMEWENLKLAIKARNRVTHPKTNADLSVSDEDIEKAKSGFFWIAALMLDVMEGAVKAFSSYVSEVADVLDDLANGDPATLSMYNRVLKELDG